MFYRYFFSLAAALGLLLAAGPASRAQPAPGRRRLDSLRRALRASRPDTSRAQVLHALASAFQQANNFDSVRRYAGQEQRLGQQLGHARAELRGLSALIVADYYQGRLPEARAGCERLIQLAEARGQGEIAAWGHNQLAGIYDDQGLYPEALAHALRVAEHYRQTRARGQAGPAARALPLYAAALSLMADIYFAQKNPAQALRLYHQLDDTLRAHPALANADNQLLNKVRTGLAGIYQAQGRYPEALRYHRLALAGVRPGGDPQDQGIVLGNLGETFMLMGQLDSAARCLRTAESLARGSGDSIGVATMSTLLAQLYQRQGRPAEARRWAGLGLRLAQRHNLPALARDATQVLADVAEAQGDFRAALAHYRASRRYHDSVFGGERRQQLAQLQRRFDRAEHEQQLLSQRLTLERERQRHRLRLLWLGLGLTLASSLAAVGWVLVRQYRLRAERDRAAQLATQAELRAAQLATQAELQQARYQLDLKQQELTSLTLSITQKGEFLDEVRGQIDSLARHQTSDEARRQLQRLRLNIAQQANTEKDWAHFTTAFEQVHQNFGAALRRRYPGITPYELRLAALLKLNLASRDMASLLGISEESVKKARYRLRRKLGLDAAVNLVDFMLGVDEEAASGAEPARSAA